MKSLQRPGQGTKKVKPQPGKRQPSAHGSKSGGANSGGANSGGPTGRGEGRQAHCTPASSEPGESCCPDVIEVYASRLRIEPQTLLSQLRLTAAARVEPWTLTDARRLLEKSMQLGLDPLAGEIYLHSQQGQEHGSGAQPITLPPLLVVSLDGWCRVLNSHPMFDGVAFSQPDPGEGGLPAWVECTIHRKDRRVATAVREYMQEARQPYGAWLSHPARMLRHKALVQCARVCFALVGVLDPDEAGRVTSARGLGRGRGPLMEPGSPPNATPGRPLGAEHLKMWLQGS
jgi:hypothetical protein